MQLEGTVRQQSEELREMRQAPRAKQKDEPPTGRRAGVDAPATATVEVDAAGAEVKAHGRRRLNNAAGGDAIGAKSWQTHIFPSGHTCNNVGGDRPKMLLPQDSSGSPSWQPTPMMSAESPHVTLVSVETDWTKQEAGERGARTARQERGGGACAVSRGHGAAARGGGGGGGRASG